MIECPDLGMKFESIASCFMHSSQGKNKGWSIRRKGSCYYHHQIHWYNTHSNKLCAIDKRLNPSAELSKPKALFHRKWEITRMRINGLHVIHIWDEENFCSITIVLPIKLPSQILCREKRKTTFSFHLFSFSHEGFMTSWFIFDMIQKQKLKNLLRFRVHK